MSKIVAVTGATGYLGKFVVPLLFERGVHVRALARPTSDRSGFHPEIEWVLGDVVEQASTRKLVAKTDAVVHLAYTHTPGRYRGGEGTDLAAWMNANLGGTFDLLLAARNAGVPQFVFLSSRAVFSRTEPARVLDETHPTSPDTHYGAYKAAVESMLCSFAAVEGMRTSAIRATGVYGMIWPVERSKWWNLVRQVIAGEPIYSASGGTEVHGKDVANTIWACLENPEHAPDLIHLSDLYVTDRRVVELARNASNLPGPLPALPGSPMANALACPRLSELGIALGGEALLAQTVADLVNAVQNSAQTLLA